MVPARAAPHDLRIASNASETRSTLTRIKGFSDSTEFTIRQYDVLSAEHMQHLNMHCILLLFPRKRCCCNCCDGPEIDMLVLGRSHLHTSPFCFNQQHVLKRGFVDKHTQTDWPRLAFCLSLRKGKREEYQIVSLPL